MAKILCAYSSLYYQCEHFPIALTQEESHHPIFDVPLKRLWKFFPKWQAGELSQVDSYLLFLALLKSTDLVQFRTAAAYTENTAAIVAQNMEELVSVLGKVVAIRAPRFVLPRFVISHDTKTLTNVRHWIQLWNNTYHDFRNGVREQDTRSKLQRREAALERLIRNPAIRPERYAHLLAQWAVLAADFPEFSVTVRGSTMPCSEYWQEIITKCYNSTDIIQIPEQDLVELLTHCEDNIELGSIFSYQLFTALREGLDTLRAFFGNGTTSFLILSPGDSAPDDVERSNLQLLINSAPTELPKRINYPSEFAYLKAKMKYELALKAVPAPSN